MKRVLSPCLGVAMAIFTLAACTTPKPHEANILPTQPKTFGAWVLNGCTISTKTAEMLLTTSGKLNEQGALELKLALAPLLTRPPYAQIDGLPVPIAVEGSGRHYTLSIPYNPDVMGRMLADKPKLRIVYQRLGETGFQEVGIPSTGALEALGVMGNSCP